MTSHELVEQVRKGWSVGERIAVWTAGLTVAIWLYNVDSGRTAEAARINAVVNSLQETTEWITSALDKHSDVPGHPGAMQELAANDQRIKEVKEDTKEIKDTYRIVTGKRQAKKYQH